MRTEIGRRFTAKIRLQNVTSLNTEKRNLVTRNALFISMVCHLLFFAGTFYLVIQSQPILSEKASIAVEIISGKRPQAPPKKITPRRVPADRAPMETSMTPAELPPALATAIPIETETARPALGQNLAVDLSTDSLSASLDLSDENLNAVSTAVRTIQDVRSSVAETESAGRAGDTAFGAKRPGPPRKERTTDMASREWGEEEEGFTPAQLEEIAENKKDADDVPFSQIMRLLAEDILETSGGGPIDVVFVIDASGSMGNNIRAVTEYLTDMVGVYEKAGVDYTLGLTEFWAQKTHNVITVTQLTENYNEYRRALSRIGVHQDENALDAIVQTVKEMEFRPVSKRHFILVTDEPFTSRDGLRIEDAIAYCREFGVYVNVLGLALTEHRRIASATGGAWHVIPEDPEETMKASQNRGLLAATARTKTRSLRNAQWGDVTQLAKTAMTLHGNEPIDIVLFIDSSESMKDKLPLFFTELGYLVRDWDNAFIDYQLGVVRFSSRGSVNKVNVFNPPQTLDQIQKIVEIPCRDNEMLLDAIAEGLRRVKFRNGARRYFILVTDEPAVGEYSPLAIIRMLQEQQILVSVIGTYDKFQQQVAAETGGVWVPIPDGHTTNNLYW